MKCMVVSWNWVSIIWSMFSQEEKRHLDLRVHDNKIVKAIISNIKINEFGLNRWFKVFF